MYKSLIVIVLCDVFRTPTDRGSNEEVCWKSQELHRTGSRRDSKRTLSSSVLYRTLASALEHRFRSIWGRFGAQKSPGEGL